jgi:hypothetical protein
MRFRCMIHRNLASLRGRLNTKQAKDFIVDQTVEQAALEGVQLADVEKRMMYFTESDPASCDNPIELNDEFEAQYETKDYETKISRLLHHAYRRLKEGNPEQVRNWDQAIRTLRKGDHYLLVMVDQSSESGVAWWMPILWGIGIAILIFILMIVEPALDQKGLIPRWVFGWISDDRQTQKFQFSLILYGSIGLWFIVKLAKLGALGDVTKTVYSSLLSTFSFLRQKGRPRR